jgi:hypothetical protein
MVHYCVADILNQTSKFIGVLDIVKKAFNLSLFRQRGQLAMNIS